MCRCLKYGSQQNSLYGLYGSQQNSLYGLYGSQQNSLYGSQQNRPLKVVVYSTVY